MVPLGEYIYICNFVTKTLLNIALLDQHLSKVEPSSGVRARILLQMWYFF